MTDSSIMIFHTDGRFVLAKGKNGARVPTTKPFQDPVARIKNLYKLDIVLDDEIKLKVHNVEMRFARTVTEPTHDDLVVYESLEKYIEDVPYEERGYPLRCKGWMSAAFAFLKKED